MVVSFWCSDGGGGPSAGEGRGSRADPDHVAAGGEHDVHRRADVVRGPAGGVAVRPGERHRLGLRPRRRRLLGRATRRRLLPTRHAPRARILRLQQLLPAERQLRRRLLLRRHRRRHHQRPK